MELRQKIEQIIEEKIRPMLHSHGGGIELVECMDGIVKIKLQGACSGCPSADLGTKAFIEETLREELTEVKKVELVQVVSSDMLDFARKILSGENK